MNLTLKDMFLKNKDLINENTEESWSLIYHNLNQNKSSHVDNFYISQFTKTLYKANIDPLKLMKNIPQAYLYEYESPYSLGFKFYDHIVEINEEAFSGCEFDTIYLPKDLIQIRPYAFETCDIQHLYFNEKLDHVYDKAFYDAEIFNLYLPNLKNFKFIKSVFNINNLYCKNNSMKEVKEKIYDFNLNSGSLKNFWSKVNKVFCKDGLVG